MPPFCTKRLSKLPLIACSHRWHRQDKTVLSCLVRVGGVNTTGNKTRHVCLVSTQFPICNCSVSNILRTTEIWKLGRDKTKLSCLVTNCVHTADTNEIKQFCERTITVVYWGPQPVSVTRLDSCRDLIGQVGVKPILVWSPLNIWKTRIRSSLTKKSTAPKSLYRATNALGVSQCVGFNVPLDT